MSQQAARSGSVRVSRPRPVAISIRRARARITGRGPAFLKICDSVGWLHASASTRRLKARVSGWDKNVIARSRSRSTRSATSRGCRRLPIRGRSQDWRGVRQLLHLAQRQRPRRASPCQESVRRPSFAHAGGHSNAFDADGLKSAFEKQLPRRPENSEAFLGSFGRPERIVRLPSFSRLSLNVDPTTARRLIRVTNGRCPCVRQVQNARCLVLPNVLPHRTGCLTNACLRQRSFGMHRSP